MPPVPSILPAASSPEIAQIANRPTQPDQEFGQILETESRKSVPASESTPLKNRQDAHITSDSDYSKPGLKSHGSILPGGRTDTKEDEDISLSRDLHEIKDPGQKMPPREEIAGSVAGLGDNGDEPDSSKKPQEMPLGQQVLAAIELYVLNGTKVPEAVQNTVPDEESGLIILNSVVETANPSYQPLTASTSSETSGSELCGVSAVVPSSGASSLDSPTGVNLLPSVPAASFPAENTEGDSSRQLETTPGIWNAGENVPLPAAFVAGSSDSGSTGVSQAGSEGTGKARDKASIPDTAADLTKVTNTTTPSVGSSDNSTKKASFPVFEETIRASVQRNQSGDGVAVDKNIRDLEHSTFQTGPESSSPKTLGLVSESGFRSAASVEGPQNAVKLAASIIVQEQRDEISVDSSKLGKIAQESSENSQAIQKQVNSLNATQIPAPVNKGIVSDGKSLPYPEANGKSQSVDSKVRQVQPEEVRPVSEFKTSQNTGRNDQSPLFEFMEHSNADGKTVVVQAAKGEFLDAGYVPMDTKSSQVTLPTQVSATQLPAHSTLANTLDMVDKATVVSQLIEKAHWISGKQGGELLINLKPEFLGRVNLQASMVGQALEATITAESPAVKTLLQSQIGNLQQSLQDHGLPVSKIVVVQGNDMSFASFGSGHAHPEQHMHQPPPVRLPSSMEFHSREPEPSRTDTLPVSHKASTRSLNLIA